MRILLIHQYFLEQDDPGGSRFNEMANQWVDLGHEVVVICGMLNYVTGKIPEKYRGNKFNVSYYRENLKVHRAYVNPGYNKNFIGRLWAYFSFVWYGTIAGIREKEPVDCIVASSPPLFVGVIALLLSWVKKVKFVFEVRDLWPESAIETGVVKNKLIINMSYWLEKKIYKKASLINVLTPAFKKVLMDKKGVPEKKLIIVPNASDFISSESAMLNGNPNYIRKELGLESLFSVVYIGAHGLANKLDQLIDAALLLKDDGVEFVLIGDGMDKKRLTAYADKSGVGNVSFLDPIPKREVYSYILAADIGISVLKKTDTFKTVYSNKTFDYMACKKPVIMAIDGVSRELVEKAQCGLYAEPENPNDIAEKIKIYLNNRNLIDSHGENGYNYAKANFDRAVLSKKYIEHLERICKSV